MGDMPGEPPAVPSDGPSDSGTAPARAGLVRAVGMTSLSSILAVMPGYLLGAMAVLVRDDIPFTPTQLGFAISLHYLVGVIIAVPAARLTERYGSTWGMRIAGLGSATSLAGTALLARSWRDIVLLLMLGGIASSMAQPATNLALARRVTRSVQGLAFGLKQASIPATTMAAGIAVPTIGLSYGWRPAFFLSALVCVPLLVILPKEQVERRARGSLRELRLGDMPMGLLALLAASAGLGVAAGNAIGAFFVVSAVEFGMEAGRAGYVLAVGSGAGVVGRILWGWLADRLDDLFLWVGALLAAGSGGFVMISTGSIGGLLLAGAVVTYSLGWGWAGMFVYGVVRLNPIAPAVATSVTSLGMRVGGIIGPALFGVVASRASFREAWLMCSVAMLLSAVGTVMIGLRMRRDRLRGLTA